MRMAAALFTLFLVAVSPAFGQWTQNGNDLYANNLNSEVGIGLTAPERQLQVRGNNAIFRLDRDINSAGFILTRTAVGNFNSIWKAYFVGVYASASGDGYFAINDLGTVPGGNGTRRLTIGNNGNVGIGTDSPARALTIGDGCLRVDRSGNAAAVWLHRFSGTTAYKTFEVGVDADGVDSGSFFISDHGSAVSGSGDKCLVIDNEGDVGIGTDTPGTFRLNVKGEKSAGHIAYLENESTGSDSDVLILQVNAFTAGNGNNFITFERQGSGVCGNIDGNGSGGVRYNTSGSDFAEWLPRLQAEEEIVSGDIVGVSGGLISKTTAGADYVQVVSSAPGWVGNCPLEEKEHLYEQVAFLGQAPVKVRGAVGAGDFIVPSGLNDGTGVAVAPAAMSSGRCGQIVGRALESSDEAAVKLVKAVVGLNASGQALQAVTLEKERQIEDLGSRLAALERVVLEKK